MEKKATNKKFILIFGVLIVVGIIYGIYKYLHSQAHEITDDAQIEKNMTPIIPRIGGYVDKIYVKDNQEVKKGDTLLVIDSRDFDVKIQEAKAALLAAEESYEVAKADINTAQATVSASDATMQSAYGSIDAAKVRLQRAQNDYERFKNLYEKRSITKQQFEQAEATKNEALAQLKVIQEQQRATSFQKNIAASRSAVSSKQIKVAEANKARAQAVLDAAQLNKKYTVITASEDGQLSKVNIQPGQMVQPGQSLFYIIKTQDLWVVANFKETQFNKMLVGQEVGITVDAFPDTEFTGKIVSFSPATGAKFSILPPDNATGNFVKTVQRLPVKIAFDDKNNKEKIARLRSGMNVTVDVHLK